MGLYSGLYWVRAGPLLRCHTLDAGYLVLAGKFSNIHNTLTADTVGAVPRRFLVPPCHIKHMFKEPLETLQQGPKQKEVGSL